MYVVHDVVAVRLQMIVKGVKLFVIEEYSFLRATVIDASDGNRKMYRSHCNLLGFKIGRAHV